MGKSDAACRFYTPLVNTTKRRNAIIEREKERDCEMSIRGMESTRPADVDPRWDSPLLKWTV